MYITLKKLESLYDEYNKFCYIHPDPLEFVYKYNKDEDREIVGLLSSALAYGNVNQILKSVSIVLNKMGESPRNYILGNNVKTFSIDFKGFKHRFTTGSDIVNMLCGIKHVLEQYDSLENCFAAGYELKGKDYLSALINFTKILNSKSPNSKSYLLPSPLHGSACKRLMLYLRWMIRSDDVDPGCWSDTVSSSKLIIPLDTHMYQISKMLDYTKRKTADFKTAIEITDQFAAINPNDPVKYDFALTRFGIRDEMGISQILL